MCIAFDGSTVLVINTDLTYTVRLQTFCTLLSGNRRDAVVSQLRQPPAEGAAESRKQTHTHTQTHTHYFGGLRPSEVVHRSTRILLNKFLL